MRLVLLNFQLRGLLWGLYFGILDHRDVHPGAPIKYKGFIHRQGRSDKVMLVDQPTLRVAFPRYTLASKLRILPELLGIALCLAVVGDR